MQQFKKKKREREILPLNSAQGYKCLCSKQSLLRTGGWAQLNYLRGSCSELSRACPEAGSQIRQGQVQRFTRRLGCQFSRRENQAQSVQQQRGDQFEQPPSPARGTGGQGVRCPGKPKSLLVFPQSHPPTRGGHEKPPRASVPHCLL